MSMILQIKKPTDNPTILYSNWIFSKLRSAVARRLFRGGQPYKCRITNSCALQHLLRNPCAHNYNKKEGKKRRKEGEKNWSLIQRNWKRTKADISSKNPTICYRNSSKIKVNGKKIKKKERDVVWLPNVHFCGSLGIQTTNLKINPT